MGVAGRCHSQMPAIGQQIESRAPRLSLVWMAEHHTDAAIVALK